MPGCSPSSPSQPDLVLTAGIRVLIVEDVQADAELIVLTLVAAKVDFTHIVTDTLADLHQYLQAQPWDVVLADYRLKGFTAYQVLELLQQLAQPIPLILVTGSLGEEAAVDCIKAGMTDYVLKDRLFRLPMVLERSLREFELYRQRQSAIAQIHQHAQREAIINRIVQAMRETLVLGEMLQTTANLLHETLQVSRCLVIRSSLNAEMVICHASEATPRRGAFIGSPCPLFNYYRSNLYGGNLVAVNSVEQILDLELRTAALEFGLSAMMLIPLVYRQEFLGGICLHQCDRERQWTAEEVALVRAIADQCAIAIHQAQLFDQVQEQAKQEQLLNQIGRALNSSLDPNYILQEIVNLTGACFDVDRALIYAIDTGRIQINKEWLADSSVISMSDYTAPVSDWSNVLVAPDGVLSKFVFHEPDYATLPQTPGRLNVLQRETRSVLSVPIFIRGQFFGGLELHTTRDYRTFAQTEITLLERIADQAALALYNAQSYDHLEQLVRDRTSELEKEKLLSDAANRTKSEFLANMSHELRTPLTGILGFSSLLLKQIFGPLTPKQQQYVENISSCGEHLLALINDLLDLSKIEAGKEELLLEPVDVREVCSTCMTSIQAQAEKQGLQLFLEVAPEIKTCIADHRRLKQILLNLLSNAVKFTTAGTVGLKVEKDQGLSLKSEAAGFPPSLSLIRFHVSDTGIGISQSDLTLLFQPFQQLDGGLNRKYQGTGLGLVLARKLAQLHRGDITVTSAVGQGSCFTLHLPEEAGSRT